MKYNVNNSVIEINGICQEIGVFHDTQSPKIFLYKKLTLLFEGLLREFNVTFIHKKDMYSV